MKLADLKVGDVYALRHELSPYMLLSADVYKRRTKRMGPTEWSKAEPGKRPRRETRSSFFYPHDDYGLLMLEGPDEQTISGIDPAPILEALMVGGMDAANEVIPFKASVILVTSLPSILGPFEQVRAAQDAARAAEEARLRKLASEYNTVVDQLNAVLGDNPLNRADGRFGAPREVRLTLRQAARIGARIADLDHRAAQLPDSGLATKP